MGFTWFANDRHASFDQMLAAGVSGAIAGAAGAAAGPLGLAAAAAIVGPEAGFLATLAVAAPVAGVVSGAGGMAGQEVANLLNPTEPGDVLSAGVWAGVGGAVAAGIPVTGMNNLRAAVDYRPQQAIMGGPTNKELWNITKIGGSLLTSSGVGLAANNPNLAPCQLFR